MLMKEAFGREALHCTFSHMRGCWMWTCWNVLTVVLSDIFTAAYCLERITIGAPQGSLCFSTKDRAQPTAGHSHLPTTQPGPEALCHVTITVVGCRHTLQHC